MSDLAEISDGAGDHWGAGPLGQPQRAGWAAEVEWYDRMGEAYVAFLLVLDNMTATTMIQADLSPKAESTDIFR